MGQAMDFAQRARHAAIRRLRPLIVPHRTTPWEDECPPQLRGGTIDFGPARVLSADPPVFLSGIPFHLCLGLAPSFARRYGNIKAGFIIFPTWTIEAPHKAKAIAAAVRRHRRRYRQHRLHYICNTPAEAELLNGFGLPALFLNHKFTVSERIFHPIAQVPVAFDAIYNARFVPEKRHELAAGIGRAAYVTYVEPYRRAEFPTLLAETLRRSPGHVLLNPIRDDLPAPFSHQEVNQALSRAATGLVLSAAEGASYAAMEYMLAGLPVVSTPSQGGRDIYFDPDYCAVVAADPRSVREAVIALRDRNIPRAYIRERTLQRIEPGRRRFLALVEEVIEALGAARRIAPAAWPFGAISGVPWDGFDTHLATFEQERAAALEREAGLAPGALDGVQLRVDELRPVVQAIRAKPGGGLLVFGCGNDSPFWESLNAGGVTAFVEDDAEWAAVARARLRSATVFVTKYGTTRRQWRTMLARPATLVMTLPDEIRSRRWDVILVDGPAGYDDDRPGRMKSIYEASRLVARGGKVFVHDSERPVEAAYAARYLRGGRLFLEAKGRAVLRGYEF
jgi:uncharacterized protein (TIGR01627 family)